MPHSETYRFGEFTFDPAERRLVRGSRPVALSPKTLDVLLVLLQRAGELVGKQELLDLVWPGAFVEEGILAVHVSALRKVLNGDVNPYIETVPRSGYRFVAPVRMDGRRSASPPIRPEVYELFGRGRAHLLSGTMETIPQALEAFRAALAIDPAYAAAHAGLALACCAQAEFRLAAPEQAYAEAKTAALTALAMDASSADAQAALGAVLFLSEWNWAGAQRA